MSDCFWCPVCWWEQAAPPLPSRLSRAVWLWHFTLAQQSRPVTVCTLRSQLLVAQPSPLLFGQLWIFQRHESNPVRHATVRPHSVSAAVWRTWGGGRPQGRRPLSCRADHVWCQKLTVRWPKYNILDTSPFPCLCLNKSWPRRPVMLSKSICDLWTCSSFQIRRARTHLNAAVSTRQTSIMSITFVRCPPVRPSTRSPLSPPKKQTISHLKFLGLAKVNSGNTSF